MAKGSTKSKSIFDTFMEATRVTKKSRESMDEFKKRLLEAVDDLSEEAFEAMPTEATKFFQKAMRAFNGKDDNKKGTLIAIPGLDEGGGEDADEPKKGKSEKRSAKDADDDEKEEGEGEVEEEEQEAEEEDEKPKDKKAAKGKEAAPAKGKGKAKDEPKKAAAKQASGSKERKPREINRNGGVYKIKEALIANPTAGVDDILDTLEKKMGKDAPTKSTVVGIRSDFLNSLVILNDKGKLTGIAGYKSA